MCDPAPAVRGREHIRDALRTDGDVGVVDYLGRLCKRRIGFQAFDFGGARVNRIDRSGIAEILQPPDEGVGDGDILGRGSKHSNCCWFKQRAELFDDICMVTGIR